MSVINADIKRLSFECVIVGEANVYVLYERDSDHRRHEDNHYRT